MQTQNSFNYKDRKYSVIPYDVKWQERFANESKILRSIFGDTIQIEHIGSTAVPGMEGKPCVDILVIPEDLEIVKIHTTDMEQAGYTNRGALVNNDALLFAKIENNTLEANIHFFPKGHPHIADMLMVRDYLRNNPKEVTAYSELKKRLYEQYPNDYNQYRKAKDQYMEELIRRAEKAI
jgi:GrpB-like predicted nucleotidyltransferase (UPF0157 family)